jgi:hypothetical protein
MAEHGFVTGDGREMKVEYELRRAVGSRRQIISRTPKPRLPVGWQISFRPTQDQVSLESQLDWAQQLTDSNRRFVGRFQTAPRLTAKGYSALLIGIPTPTAGS